MNETVYTKTPAGQREITDRQLRLHPRLRSLLVLIDGRHRAGELLQTLSAIGITEASFEELERHGLVAASAASTPAPIEESGPPTEFVPRPERPLDETERKRELYTFFNEAIRNHLGLRGFMLQLQVEKAETLADYHAIRDQFIAAVGKSKGSDFAKRQSLHIDTLLDTAG